MIYTHGKYSVDKKLSEADDVKLVLKKGHVLN